MSVWIYKEDSVNSDIAKVRTTNCIFCRGPLQLIAEYRYGKMDNEFLEQLFLKTIKNRAMHMAMLYGKVSVCSLCGWWNFYCTEDWTGDTFGGYGSLKELDLGDLSTPIDEIQQYLMGRYEDRFIMHPRLLEETVASVFSNLGFEARVTAYHSDGGIDVILDGPNDETVGIQVKRYKNKIKTEQIRSLAGALVLRGITKGIFVTTSDYQLGCEKTSAKFKDQGYAIELYNSQRFYEAMRLNTTEAIDSTDSLVNTLGRIPDPQYIGIDYDVFDD